MKKLLLPILGLAPLMMWAGGFQVNLQGTKQTGMGHLGTSFYLGASSTYFNPALMGLDSSQFNLEAGASFIMGSVAFQDQSTGITERTDNPTGTPFYLYATYRINDDITAGLGIYTPFGSSVKWGDDWSGRNLIQDISLTAIFIQPTVSYNVTEDLSVGAGLTYAIGSFEINRAIPSNVGNNNTVNLEGSESGIGFNAGLFYQATEKLGVGVSYRSQVDIELKDGDAEFNVDPLLSSSFPNGKFSATLPLPSTFTLGVSYEVTSKLLVAAEVNMVGWSAYESLDFDFETNTSLLEDSKNARNYEDAMIYRIGGQYTINKMIDVRAGFYYDESPVTDEYFTPETPNTDNLGFTAGASVSPMENLVIDASFLFISGQERESEYKPLNFGGKYKATSVIPGIGLNYKF